MRGLHMCFRRFMTLHEGTPRSDTRQLQPMLEKAHNNGRVGVWRFEDRRTGDQTKSWLSSPRTMMHGQRCCMRDMRRCRAVQHTLAACAAVIKLCARCRPTSSRLVGRNPSQTPRCAQYAWRRINSCNCDGSSSHLIGLGS
ncbi:hypothetical protein M011DRAFT_114953 [Sporormia fimetaria CBS 119925]|uniref:Uncharacterized protein n=1 Tax=Sporormia fimetaria CBS 119925 TaxID=1340428 RepID=A0A6A6VQF6_9PLEO|nr:hypothetical protein M011DRAFT_114953 [Sporormia fimetaria CBS 119925]